MTMAHQGAVGTTARIGRFVRLWPNTPRSFRIGFLILLFWVVVAIAGPFLAPYGPSEIRTGTPLSGMSWAHPFGVDQLGRDVLSRVVHGAHLVMLLSISATLLGLVIGSFLGLLSGYLGGWFDEVVMRLAEALISIPFLILAMLIISVAGPGLSGNPILVIVAVAVVYIPRITRMARSAALDIITKDYITITRLRGEGPSSVVRREMLPNATGVLLVEFATRAGYAPVLIGSLGFLGFGMRPPTPEWGLMISEYRGLIFLSPVTLFGPGLALASLVVGLNLCTDGVARILGRTVQQVNP
ncbi:MAG TPA: ABC transporter permease [Chloroflexota bacterium]|nr:ABC transporter permease [Chloroflexota bacterium]